MIYLTAIGLTPGGSSTVHIYTQTIPEQHNGHKIHRTTQLIHGTTQLSSDWLFPFSFFVYCITEGFVDQSLHSHCCENLKSQLISHCMVLMVIFHVTQLQCKNTCKWHGHRRLLTL